MIYHCDWFDSLSGHKFMLWNTLPLFIISFVFVLLNCSPPSCLFFLPDHGVNHVSLVSISCFLKLCDDKTYLQVVLVTQLVCWTGQFIGHGIFEVNIYHFETVSPFLKFHTINIQSISAETSTGSSGQPCSSIFNGSLLCASGGDFYRILT